MPVTYVGAAGSLNANSTSGITRAWPAGHQSGDVAIIICTYSKGTTRTAPTVAGHTVYEFPMSRLTGSDVHDIGVWFVYATSGSMGAITYDALTTNGVSPASYRNTALVFRGTGGSGSTYPFSKFEVSYKNTADTGAAFPSITTTDNDTMILWYGLNTDPTSSAGATFSGTYANADVTSLTQVNNTQSTSNDAAGTALLYGTKASAGSVGAGSGFTMANSSKNVMITMAVGGTPYTPPTSASFNARWYSRRRRA